MSLLPSSNQSLTQWRSEMDPFGQMEHRMSSLFRGFLCDFNQLTNVSDPSVARTVGYWCPRSDLYEDATTYHIHAELPGVEKKDLQVEAKEEWIRIMGETKRKQQQQQVKGEGEARYVERRYGRFERVYVLPKGCQAERVQAKFENGVLEVIVPKKQQDSDVKRIQIQ